MEDVKETGALKEGIQTSEYATAKSTGMIANIVIALGFVMAFAPQVTGAVEGTAAQTYVAGALAVIGMIARVLVSLGYMKSRETVKAAAIHSAAVEE